MLSTLEILELEKKVFKYRIKKRLPYLILGALFFFLFSIGYVFYSTSTSKEDKSSPISATQYGEPTPIESNLSTHMPIKEQNISDDTLLLQLPLIGKKSPEKKGSYLAEPTQNPIKVGNPAEEPLQKITKNEEESFYRSKEDRIDTLLLPPPLLVEEKPKGIIKIETHEVNSITYLKERFEKSHNIIYALMLAEEYYLSKNYQDSNKWSIIANTIDSDNEKSWILFAKSKLKLGHKQDAISALEAYLKNNKSKVVQNLLTQIMSGESID